MLPSNESTLWLASLSFCSRRLRWNSFQLSHQPQPSPASPHISSQTAGQLNLLQRFSLLRLTAIMEKYSMSNKHGWTWCVARSRWECPLTAKYAIAKASVFAFWCLKNPFTACPDTVLDVTHGVLPRCLPSGQPQLGCDVARRKHCFICSSQLVSREGSQTPRQKKRQVKGD